MIFYFDIDNTITVTNGTYYANAEPRSDRIAQINKLFDEGHRIVYWTARGGKTKIDHKALTEIQLQAWGAKYHEIKFEKGDFDVLIDDKAISSELFFQPKRIGLVLNNLIRDYIGKLSEIYIKYTTKKDATEPNMPILPINPYQLEYSFPLVNDEFDNIYTLLYHAIPLEVFGGANQTCTNLLQRLCNFQTKINDELIILSRETPRSKIATLSFLSKNQFDLGKIIFVENYEDYWNHVDILITDNPEILKVKPPNKKAVILANDYNLEYYTQEYKIISPEEIFDLPIFDRKLVKEEELIHITNIIPEGEEEDKLIVVEQNAVEGAKVVGVYDHKEVDVDLTEMRDKIDDTPPTESDN